MSLISADNPGDFSGFHDRREIKVREVSEKSPIDLWANFLYNEKLDPRQLDVDSVMELIYLCEELAKKRGPLIRPYKEKLISRRFVVDTALDLGIDLIDFRSKWNRKHIIGRGLLDVWMVAYRERYGSTTGTVGEWEAKRRDIKTKLAKAKRATVDPLSPGTGLELKTTKHPKDCRCIFCDIPYYGGDGQGGY